MKTVIYYYSATGITKKYAEAFAKAFDDAVTMPVMHGAEKVKDGDLLVFAAPVYAGRIPKNAMNAFRSVCLKNKPIVGIAVYGNMHFGAAFKQFQKLAHDNGSVLTGTGAFVARHSYSTPEAPICHERPDFSDLREMELFGKKVREKVESNDLCTVNLPFSLFPQFLESFPNYSSLLAVKKPVITGECAECGACVRVCPCGAINPKTLKITNAKCSRCFACVKVCNTNARRGELRIKGLKYPFAWLGRKRKKNIYEV